MFQVPRKNLQPPPISAVLATEQPEHIRELQHTTRFIRSQRLAQLVHPKELVQWPDNELQSHIEACRKP